jgi:hypothetical protein
MSPAAQRRLGHGLQAIRSIQSYTADAPLQEWDSLLAACARMRDWQHLVAELVGFVAGDLQVWQGRLIAGLEQAGRGGVIRSADCRESFKSGF